MLYRLALATLIAAGGVAAAHQAPSSQPPSGIVLVRVLDAATGQPISGASVGAGDVGAKTDVDGRARLERVSAGSWWAGAFADGYLESLEALAPKMFDRILTPPETDSQRWAAHHPELPGTRPVTVKPNQEVEVEFRLPRAGSIEGRVVAPDGTAVRGVSIKALQLYSEGPESRTFVPVDAAKTDQEGRFVFSRLRPSSYYLRVETAVDDEFSRVPIFYPSETNPRRAQAIVVRSGETARAEIGLRYVRALPITGTVVDSQGRPVPGETRMLGTMPRYSVDLSWRRLDVDCCSDSFPPVHVEEVDARGRFRTQPLPPGRYRFKSGIHAVAMVHDSTSVKHVVVQIHERAVVSGRVVPQIKPTDEGYYSIDLDPEDGPSERGGTTQPNPDGEFSVGVAPGRYRVNVRLPRPWVAAAVKLADGRNVIDEVITLRPGEALDGVTVEVGASVRITGRVFPADLIGPRGYEVIAFPAARELWDTSERFYAESWTDENDNTFTIEGLAPGMEYLVAVHPWGALRSTAWLERAFKTAVRVSAPKAGTYRADIDLEKVR